MKDDVGRRLGRLLAVLRQDLAVQVHHLGMREMRCTIIGSIVNSQDAQLSTKYDDFLGE